MTRIVGLLAVLACLVAPASAAAQEDERIAPPGNSAIDEYLETVPGADGNRRVDRSRDGGLAPADRRALERLGADGRLAAEVLGDSVSSDPAVRRAARSRGSSGGGAVAGSADSLSAAGPGKSGLGAVLDGVLAGGGDGPGMGALLPILLIGSLIAFLAARALAAVRRRA